LISRNFNQKTLVESPSFPDFIKEYYGSSKYKAEGYSKFLYAMERGYHDIDLVRLLADCDVEVNMQVKNRFPILKWVIQRHSSDEVLNYLIDDGAETDNAIFDAVRYGRKPAGIDSYLQNSLNLKHRVMKSG
jgi:hypothetical protein